MNRSTGAWLCGAGIGAGAAFLLDPDRGARRRALIRDKAVRATHRTRDAVSATSRDVRNRAAGLIAETRVRFAHDDADDRVVSARVRAEIGRVASHPRALSIVARDGVVVISGDALASEAPRIVAAARRVRGADWVDNQMTVHENADAVPSLQGESSRPGHWTTWLRTGWSPTAILVASAGAAAVALLAARRAA